MADKEHTGALKTIKKKYDLFWMNPKTIKYWGILMSNLHVYSRIVVCIYFLNFSLTQIQIWYYGADTFPPSCFIAIPCAILVLFNQQVRYCGMILLILAFWHSSETVWGQFLMWWAGHGLYFNELMVKRLAVTGCMMMVIGRHILENNAKETSGFAGLLLEEKKNTMANKQSGVLLVARLFISILFLFVGYTEIQRQLNPPMHGNHVHGRPKGDGHDEVWAKALQFFFSLPLTIGLFTKSCSRILSVVCFLEAFIMWRFWTTEAYGLGLGYAIHAREHFSVNVAVSGGLLLLQSFGAGKYSMDNYLKKTE